MKISARHACRSRSRFLLAAIAFLAQACASPPARPPAPPAPPPPVAGQSVSELMPQLSLAAGTARVRLGETELHRTDVDPWEDVRLQDAEGSDAALALVATRRCSHREGVRRDTAELASWYLFDRGRLRAFDHAAFDGYCGVSRHFLPSSADEPEPERSLKRWVIQRNPGSALETADRFRLGIALVEVGRLEEARRLLKSGSRDVQALAQRVRLEGSAEEAELDAQVEDWKALRSQLVRALEKAEEEQDAAKAAAD